MAKQQTISKEYDDMLIEKIASFKNDPLGFVLYAFPWGEDELKGKYPDDWQIEQLKSIGEKLQNGTIKSPEEAVSSVIREAIASGHGIGKSAQVSFITWWAMSTFPDTKGVITANTLNQLRTKTWTEISKWYQYLICKHWFKLEATSIKSVDHEKENTWRIDIIPWSENNTEAFAGLHNEGKRILVIFDEASSIPDGIWEVTEGALTDKDTQIIWLVYGNPTRSQGRFYDCFDRFKHRWTTRQIDARNVKITNKLDIQEKINDYGVDSDYVKVRIRGEFPSTSDRQFIPTNYVDAARGRHLRVNEYNFAPVVIGVDSAWSGDEICIYLRQGNMSKKLGSYYNVQDDLVIAGYVAHFEDEYKADAVFIDQGYGTGIRSAGKAMNRQWVLISFANKPTNPVYANKRAEMWGEMKDWLKDGGSIEDDPILARELTSPEFEMRLDSKILLESKDDMKKRGLSSPNRGDALALTFAQKVLPKKNKFLNQFGFIDNKPKTCVNDYKPFSYGR
jgi:hypothetical protein